MLITKLVVRLLGEREELLGWAEIAGEARGDGKIWISDPTRILIEQEGMLSYNSFHWCDINVEIRSIVESQRVKVGDCIVLPGELVAFTLGPAAGGLPPVTVKNPVTIGIPVGQLGVKGN